MLLSLGAVTKAFGTDIVVSDASFRLERTAKVGLVGRNGCGKTTLLRLITGEYEKDGGSIALAPGASIGYLRQEDVLDESLTVLEAAQEARRHALELQERLHELERRMESDPDPDLVEEYTLLHERFLEAEGYNVEADLRTILSKMGFTEADDDKRVGSLSGGERTRLAIARLLLEEPDLVILDEPTNHLDMAGIEWLERWVRGYHGAVLIVSHDREFLQNTVSQIIEMRDGKTKTYPGPFDKYVQLRAEEDRRLEEVVRRQDEQIAKLDEYVRRFMGNQRTAQARGRLKMMNRLLESKVEGPANEKTMKAGFGKAKRSGDIVVEAKGLGMSFGARTLFQGLDWTVRWTERWGIIGENGVGKSTLIRALVRELAPSSGWIRIGANVDSAYFSQNADDFEPNETPIGFLIDECGMQVPAARDLLGRFLISGDDAFRAIGTFSGGEKNKLALARLTVLNPNLLILDEPTNHLDMQSREALAGVLRDYTGTLIIVSHDRWFLDHTTNRTLNLRRDGHEAYEGPYREYRAHLERRKAPDAKAQITLRAQPSATPHESLSPREISKRIGQTERELEAIETRIGDLETEIAALEADLAEPLGKDVVALSTRHAAAQSELAEALEDWADKGEDLESLRAAQGVRA